MRAKPRAVNLFIVLFLPWIWWQIERKATLSSFVRSWASLKEKIEERTDVICNIAYSLWWNQKQAPGPYFLNSENHPFYSVPVQTFSNTRFLLNLVSENISMLKNTCEQNYTCLHICRALLLNINKLFRICKHLIFLRLKIINIGRNFSIRKHLWISSVETCTDDTRFLTSIHSEIFVNIIR